MSAILTDVAQSPSFCSRVRCWSGGLWSSPSRQWAFVHASARSYSAGS